MSEHRHHKQHEIDYSNLLPDCLLHHILSFMPTKEAVKTSVLSTRWKNLWASVPNIDIDDELLMAKLVDGRCRHDVTSFVKFVERVLRLRDAYNMEKFRLSCHAFRDAFQIHAWIFYAIMHNVQDLDLSLSANDPSVIPRSMFDSTSLVSLKIRMSSAIELPSHVSFPCLKTLHLSYVRFPHHDFTEKLFLGCPVLEELVLFRCSLWNLKNVVISSSTLKSLSILDVSRCRELDDPTCGCKINIDAVNLTYFEYIGFLSNEIILNTPSLAKSFIDTADPDGRQNEVACRAYDLLNQLQNVVSLRLSNEAMETLIFADNIRFPTFPNLTHLKLFREFGKNSTFRVLMDLLSFCPALQSICFSEGFKHGMRLGENNSIWSSIPICISNSLKTVTLIDFRGDNSEICFLKRVLKTVCALERVDIWWPKFGPPDPNKKTKVRKELQKIKRKAATCVIKFS